MPSDENYEDQFTEQKRELLFDYYEFREMGFGNPKIYIKNADHKGMGVFAKERIKAGEPVEYCHSIVLKWRKKYHNDKALLRYVFSDIHCKCKECRKHGPILMLPLGYGGIYNCSSSQETRNCEYVIFQPKRLIIFIATKDIEPDEEITCWFGDLYYKYYCESRIGGRSDAFVAPEWTKQDLAAGMEVNLENNENAKPIIINNKGVLEEAYRMQKPQFNGIPVAPQWSEKDFADGKIIYTERNTTTKKDIEK
jgi:hypothetical protein